MSHNLMTRRVLVGLAPAAILVGFAPGVSAQEAKKLRIGWGTTLEGAGGTAVKKMAEVLKEKTRGRIELVLFPNSQLGGEVEMLSQIRSGNLDLGLIGSGVVSGIEPSLQVTILPFIWKSPESFWKVVNGPIGDRILSNFDSKGIKGLAWGTFGERAFLTIGFPVNSPADLKGKKIRVTQAQMFMKTMETMGGNPVPLPWPEVYTALQTKTVQGVETSIWSAPEAKLYEVTTDLAVTKHFIDTATFLMNGAAFNALSPEDQKAIIEAARAGGQAHFEATSKATDEAIELMAKRGMKVAYPNLAPFRDAVAPVYKLFEKDIGANLIEEVKAAQN